MSTINIVKYYFHIRNIPATDVRKRQLVALAYQRTKSSILRQYSSGTSEVHNTTTINGRRQKDPRGDHVTFSYKSQDHQGRKTHVACHGYVKDTQTLEFKEATHADEKPDATKKQSGKAAWPEKIDLWEAPDIGYGHMPPQK
ncbi:hypothetical protein F4679DRAFT_578393 [Xylaria curta]|nr:hypothetical protein F4679DRAFT_578393 [Xylaria curta]